MYSFFSVLPAATVILLFPIFLGLSAVVVGSCYIYPHPGESPRLHKLSCYAVFECRVLPLSVATPFLVATTVIDSPSILLNAYLLARCGASKLYGAYLALLFSTHPQHPPWGMVPPAGAAEKGTPAKLPTPVNPKHEYNPPGASPLQRASMKILRGMGLRHVLGVVSTAHSTSHVALGSWCGVHVDIVTPARRPPGAAIAPSSVVGVEPISDEGGPPPHTSPFGSVSPANSLPYKQTWDNTAMSHAC